ncbi:MAG: hypothetical protein Q8J78_01460 [Moraxellaceae bacterium]|nr:hypothetical protein [Moraxellaceae bacterium]
MTEPSGFLDYSSVPKSLLPHIGTIAVRYAQMDFALNRAIWDLLAIHPKDGRIVTERILNFSTRSQMFVDLAHLARTSKAERVRITDLGVHMHYAGDDRNRLIHDVAILGSATEPQFNTMRMGTKGHPWSRQHKFNADTLNDLAERLHDMEKRLRSFVDAKFLPHPMWLSEPLPSLGKSPTLLLKLKNELLQSEKKPKSQPKSSPRSSPAARRRAALLKIAKA